MTQNVRARFRNGVFEPLEDVDVDDDSIVNLVIETHANTPQDELDRMEVEEHLRDRRRRETAT